MTADPTSSSAPAPIIPPDLIEQARADQPAKPAGDPVVIVTDWPAEGRDLVDFTLTLLTPLSPSLAGVYPPEVRARLAVHLGAVLKKYDCTMAVLFGRFAPEFGLLMVAAPLIAPTLTAIRTDRAAKAAAAGAPAGPPADRPAANDSAAGPADVTAAPAGPSPLVRFAPDAKAATKT